MPMYMHVFIVSLVAFFLYLKGKEYFSNDCLLERSLYSSHLGTKTPYRFVSNKNDSAITYKGCEPKKMWMVSRHGSRFPSEEDIKRMMTRLPELQTFIVNNHKLNNGALCEEALANLTYWSPEAALIDAKRLVHEGESEMNALAKRLQKRFPSLLTADYSNSTYQFRCTATQRTIESQKHFTVGLLGQKVADLVWSPEPLHKDPILRFYKLCTKWKKEVDDAPDALSEKIKFEESLYMKMSVSNISRRLGFHRDLPLSDVQLMYLTCGFETAWSPFRVSPWCAAFTRIELETLEYAEDLEYYWIDGYGYDINYEQACPILRDMLQRLTSEDGPTSTFYFTHSGTLLKLLAHLGLYKDRHKLTHETFPGDRLWRVSLIDAFGTNLAFVLYDCGGVPKLLTMHQEWPIRLPGCEDDLCPMEDVLRTYRGSVSDCNFSEMCRLD